MKTKKLKDDGLFIWDWREQPPILGIISFARKNPQLKMFEAGLGTDTNVLVFAKNKKEAGKIADVDHSSRVAPWKDECQITNKIH